MSPLWGRFFWDSGLLLNFYTHVAPLGLGFFGIPVFYTHVAPLGLRAFTRECYLLKELFRRG